jgi:carbon monoxide dehydrogenase subunit G
VLLENSFDVPAPQSTAWQVLNDVVNVIPCMPGAELVEIVDENTWKANMRVKLGPISMQFATDVSRTEADEAGGRVVLQTKARESRGKGMATATIVSRLTDTGSGTCVDLTTDLTLQGAVAQYGRGIVADVAARLTEQFATCIAARVSEAQLNDAQGNGRAAEAGAGAVGARAGPLHRPEVQAVPINGFRLFLGALWRRLVGRSATGTRTGR